MKLLAALDDFGFEKTRRAVAALALSFFVSLYVMLSLNAPDGWAPAFLALALCYVVAFLAVAAEWFWGRWFAAGLGWSGLMVAVMSTVMLGWMWPLAIYGGLHGLVVVLLLGKRMTALYDLQEGWRKRFAMDEFGVARLRKTVTRSAASLPSMILWALGPTDPGQGSLHGLFLLLAVGFGVAGLAGVIRLRTWGLVAMGAAATALVAHGAVHVVPEIGAVQSSEAPAALHTLMVMLQPMWGVNPGSVAVLTLFGTLLPATLLIAAVAPFSGAMGRFLLRRRA